MKIANTKAIDINLCFLYCFFWINSKMQLSQCKAFKLLNLLPSSRMKFLASLTKRSVQRLLSTGSVKSSFVIFTANSSLQ